VLQISYLGCVSVTFMYVDLRFVDVVEDVVDTQGWYDHDPKLLFKLSD